MSPFFMKYCNSGEYRWKGRCPRYCANLDLHHTSRSLSLDPSCFFALTAAPQDSSTAAPSCLQPLASNLQPLTSPCRGHEATQPIKLIKLDDCVSTMKT